MPGWTGFWPEYMACRPAHHKLQAKKNRPEGRFCVPEPGITGQEQPGQRRQQQRRQLRQQRLQRRQQQQQRRQQQRQLRRQRRQQQQQLRSRLQPLRSQLQQAQQLLLFGRKRSWKQPAERPGGRNISFDFP
ncbi:MAG: hypothetical protein Q8M46_01420 [Thiobacillus sp.]|nr:hypothetical protein [Thiobacillus sp.]